MGIFRFKQFAVRDDSSALKVGTDAVLLGAAMTIRPSDRRLLDVGTGCGVIALMAAQRLSTLHGPHPEESMEARCNITAIDIDPAAAGEAASNFAASPWAGALSAGCVPLSGYLPAEPFDLIFSNPPYYDESLKNPDPRSASARHTESLSYRELCAFAARYLSTKGRLSLILPSDRKKDLLKAAASFGLRPFRLLHIRSTARKGVSRLLAEFSRSESAQRPVIPSCAADPGGRAHPEGQTDSPKGTGSTLDTIAGEELILLNPDGSRSAAYQKLTGEFYL